MDNPIKPRLLELVDVARATKQAFIDGLTEAQRDEIASPGEWAARDHVAHVTFWEDRYVLRLATQLRGEAPPPSLGEEDAVNAQVLADQHTRSWPDLEAEAARVYAALTATIEEGSEAALTGPSDQASVTPRPVWSGIADSIYDHPAMHYADYYRAHDDLPRATQVREDVVATLARLFPGSAAHGYALYNLGCFYSAHRAGRQSDPGDRGVAGAGSRPDGVVHERQRSRLAARSPGVPGVVCQSGVRSF